MNFLPGSDSRPTGVCVGAWIVQPDRGRHPRHEHHAAVRQQHPTLGLQSEHQWLVYVLVLGWYSPIVLYPQGTNTTRPSGSSTHRQSRAQLRSKTRFANDPFVYESWRGRDRKQ